MRNKISVVVPVYNAEQHIEACLNSLLTQTYTNLEILIVDDGSTDRSKYIIEEYAKKDHRIRPFFTKNQGVSAARNVALRQVTGNWIAFCDSDDLVPCNAYKRMLQAALSADADVVVGTLKLKKPKETISFTYHKRLGPFPLFYNGPSLCNRLFKYDTIRGVQFDPLIVGEDVVFLTKIFNKTHRITSVRQPVYIYINRENSTLKSLTHLYSLSTFKSHITAWTIVMDLWSSAIREYGEPYLVHTTTPYLYQQMLCVPTIEAKCSALIQFKAFLGKIPWHKYESAFEATFGIKYNEFCSKTEMEYFDSVISQDCKERILAQFYVGHIGFRYIEKYMIQWWKFKCHRR